MLFVKNCFKKDFLTIKSPFSYLYMIIFLWLEPWMDYAYSAERKKILLVWSILKNFNLIEFLEKWQVFWKERPITISWYCWQTKNHLYIAVKPPSKAIQVSKSMSHGSKWDRPNSIHCCYVSQIHTNTTYSGYIREGGNIFHHILDVLIPLKNWPWIFHGTTNILNFEEKISWTTLTSSL